MNPGPERIAPPVNLDLPIVQELIEKYGHEEISYETPEGKHVGTVRHAFEVCGDLSQIGEQNEAVLRLVIREAINKTAEGNS